ncbi:MAG: hypothetical protein LBK95_18170, partial [Bifidobacteriaceae bacterium]|nr:hypothetical protein [Bifidobacteriaceae bacterium]
MRALLGDEAFRREHGWYLSGVEPGMPSAGSRPGTCRVCGSPVRAGYSGCPRCDAVGAAVAATGEPFPLDSVAFLTYAVEGAELAGRAGSGSAEDPREREGRQAYAVLKGYKADGAPPRMRTDAAAWTTWFLQRWGPQAAWPARSPDREWRWATVPSVRSGRRGEHPFHRLVAALLSAEREVPIRALETPGGRDFNPARFECGPIPAGAPVLVLDDSWTSGANVFSAAAAMRRAGAGAVAAMVLGRLL